MALFYAVFTFGLAHNNENTDSSVVREITCLCAWWAINNIKCYLGAQNITKTFPMVLLTRSNPTRRTTGKPRSTLAYLRRYYSQRFRQYWGKLRRKWRVIPRDGRLPTQNMGLSWLWVIANRMGRRRKRNDRKSIVASDEVVYWFP